MNTIGKRVGYLYDRLADPTFSGDKAMSLMTEYTMLTRVEGKPELALFLSSSKAKRSNLLLSLVVFGGTFLIILSWLNLLKKAIEADRASHREVLELKKRIKNTLERQFPDTMDFEATFNLPEGFFDGIE